jgi:hypothetical protein
VYVLNAASYELYGLWTCKNKPLKAKPTEEILFEVLTHKND